MPTSVQKIAAGLTAAQKGTTAPLAGLRGLPTSVSDLNHLASLAHAKRDRLKLITDGIIKAVADREARVTEEWRERGIDRQENGARHDTIGATKRAKYVRDEVAAYRRDALRISSEERTTIRRELGAIRDQIETVKAMWSDPVALLMRSTLADAKRSVYAANLAASGPAEIEATLRHAVMTGDRALAAAALSRLDTMDSQARKSVSLSRADVAKALVAEEHAAASQFIGMAVVAIEDAAIADDTAEGKEIAPSRKIALGALKQSLGFENGEPPTPPDDDPTKQRPGETFEQYLDRKYPAAVAS